MNIYVFTGAAVSILTGAGAVLGFIYHPMLGAAIWGAGSWLIFHIGNLAGSIRAVQYMVDHFDVYEKELNPNEPNAQ